MLCWAAPRRGRRACRAHAPLRLPERVDGRPLPAVEVLDMRGRHQPLHPETRIALADLRRAGGKAIVLLNRRGWSNFLSCRSCGACLAVPQLRRRARAAPPTGAFVACHHCGHREPVPEPLPGVRVGLGRAPRRRHRADRARAARRARRRRVSDLPARRRLGRRSTRARGRCSASRPRGAGVLVGTQMVAKGHDFPDVSLGVVLDADQTLRFPDFRAEERTFALVTQLAGRDRARRARRPGARADAGARGARRSGSRPATTPTASSPASSAAARAALPAVRDADPGRLLGAEEARLASATAVRSSPS